MCNFSEFIVKATVTRKKGRCDPESVFFFLQDYEKF